MDFSPIVERLQSITAQREPALLSAIERAGLELVSSRPLDRGADGKHLGVSLRLRLPPRDLGRVLASASLQDRITTLVADAVVRDGTETTLLELAFGSTDASMPISHPYRTQATQLGTTPSSVAYAARGHSRADAMVLAVRELVEGLFDGREVAPLVEVSAVADEVVLVVEASSMIFNQLAPLLRDAVLRIAPKVLIQRQR